MAVSYFGSVYLGQSIELKMLVEGGFLGPKRFWGVPSFFNFFLGYSLKKIRENLRKWKK